MIHKLIKCENMNLNPDRGLILAFRRKTNCRQYPFGTVADFKRWACRKPYSGEEIRVIVFGIDRAKLGDTAGRIPAAEAVLWIDGLATDSESGIRPVCLGSAN